MGSQGRIKDRGQRGQICFSGRWPGGGRGWGPVPESRAGGPGPGTGLCVPAASPCGLAAPGREREAGRERVPGSQKPGS